VIDIEKPTSVSDSSKNLVMEPRWVLDTKTDCLTVGRNVTLTLATWCEIEELSLKGARQ
jgi:hypothetical protein